MTRQGGGKDEECTCGVTKQHDYETIRANHGHETHSPFCPVGVRERLENNHPYPNPLKKETNR